MTRQEARRAVNMYLAAFALLGAHDWPEDASEKDRELFFAELEAKGNEILERLKFNQRIPQTIGECLKAAKRTASPAPAGNESEER